jgi:peptidoglycan biosynthesis protein MviN/MurJ (putative lipid II flippase)
MWTSDRRQSISRYKTPVGGGLISLIAMMGMAIVLMIGSNFARQFLSLAIPAGCLVALVLYCARRRRQNSYIPFL